MVQGARPRSGVQGAAPAPLERDRCHPVGRAGHCRASATHRPSDGRHHPHRRRSCAVLRQGAGRPQRRRRVGVGRAGRAGLGTRPSRPGFGPAAARALDALQPVAPEELARLFTPAQDRARAAVKALVELGVPTNVVADVADLADAQLSAPTAPIRWWCRTPCSSGCEPSWERPLWPSPPRPSPPPTQSHPVCSTSARSSPRPPEPPATSASEAQAGPGRRRHPEPVLRGRGTSRPPAGVGRHATPQTCSRTPTKGSAPNHARNGRDTCGVELVFDTMGG